MKIKQVRAKLIRSAIICAAIVFGGMAFYFVMNSFASSMTDNIESVKADISNSERKQKEIRERIDLSEAAAKYYQDFLAKNGPSDSKFKREVIRNELVGIKNDLLLSNVQYTVDPFIEYKNAYKKENAVLISSKVNLQYFAVTDAVALKAVQELKRKLPGYVQILELKTIKSRDFLPQDLTDLDSGKAPQIVNVNLTFNWVGVREIQGRESISNEQERQ